MDQEFEQGFALIMEADTEYQFYQALFLHYGRKHPECSIECLNDPVTFEPHYIVHGSFGKRIVRLNAVGTITQIHNSASWFSNRCLSGHPQAKNWTVFLCYDMDDYSSDVSKFYEGDWAQFRSQLSLLGVQTVIDLAASADIEDIFLLDLDGISRYMELSQPLTSADIPSGRKGAARLKRLFAAQRSKQATRKAYHKGERSRALIDCLDLDRIITQNLLPLFQLEQIFL